MHMPPQQASPSKLSGVLFVRWAQAERRSCAWRMIQAAHLRISPRLWASACAPSCIRCFALRPDEGGSNKSRIQYRA